MSQTFNVYCDESCHLENDHQRVMVLGAIWCPAEKIRLIADEIRAIKQKNGLSENFEIKWTKVSPGKVRFYLDIVDYFFEKDDLHFRGLIVPDKSRLEHERYDQDHDKWFYKMYFRMLNVILGPHDKYRIYLDIKDTCGAKKVQKLHDVLCNNIYDFDKNIIERVQLVRSHEIEILQITDLLIGAVSYVNRALADSSAKLMLIDRIKNHSEYKLTKSTLLKESKFNLFRWQAS